MVCSRSGSLALENAGDRSLVACDGRRVTVASVTISASKENVLGRNLLKLPSYGCTDSFTSSY